MNSDSSESTGTSSRTQPESFRGRALSASLTVNDLQKSLTWYRDVLGFTVESQYEHDGKAFAVSLKAGAVQILIGQDDGAKGMDRVKGVGFSLQITTAQNVDEIAKRIKERGGRLELEPTTTRWGPRIIRLRDPDGFALTISSVPAA
jgi:uncharacterized glyoxalase superfamily protein PhnB